MKITKRQLRRIIREAMVTAGTPYSKNPSSGAYELGFDDRLKKLDPRQPEDEDYMQGWRDGGDELAPLPDEGIRRRGW